MSAQPTILYSEQETIIIEAVCRQLEQGNAQELANIVSLAFSMFPKPRLIESLLALMRSPAPRPAFEVLTRLLNDAEGTEHPFIRYLSAFVIPVIQGIQSSRTIFGNDKQVTLILAQLLSLLPLNLALTSASNEESKVSRSLHAKPFRVITSSILHLKPDWIFCKSS